MAQAPGHAILWGLALLGLFLSMGLEVPRRGLAATAGDPDKVGAGFLFIAPDSSVLLLQRAGKHHAGKWMLPGGNAEAGDRDLLATAKREAAEELGGAAAVPPYKLAGPAQGFLTRRGKFGSKHFTVFVAKVPESAKASKPLLQASENSAYRWVKFGQLAAMEGELHPVMRKLLARYRDAVLRAAGIGDA